VGEARPSRRLAGQVPRPGRLGIQQGFAAVGSWSRVQERVPGPGLTARNLKQGSPPTGSRCFTSDKQLARGGRSRRKGKTAPLDHSPLLLVAARRRIQSGDWKIMVQQQKPWEPSLTFSSDSASPLSRAPRPSPAVCEGFKLGVTGGVKVSSSHGVCSVAPASCIATANPGEEGECPRSCPPPPPPPPPPLHLSHPTFFPINSIFLGPAERSSPFPPACR
jgi:hypothetical protein